MKPIVAIEDLCRLCWNHYSDQAKLLATLYFENKINLDECITLFEPLVSDSEHKTAIKIILYTLRYTK